MLGIGLVATAPAGDLPRPRPGRVAGRLRLNGRLVRRSTLVELEAAELGITGKLLRQALRAAGRRRMARLERCPRAVSHALHR